MMDKIIWHCSLSKFWFLKFPLGEKQLLLCWVFLYMCLLFLFVLYSILTRVCCGSFFFRPVYLMFYVLLVSLWVCLFFGEIFSYGPVEDLVYVTGLRFFSLFHSYNSWNLSFHHVSMFLHIPLELFKKLVISYDSLIQYLYFILKS